MNKLEYIKDSSTGIETISYENVNISYPEHTHIGHIVMGIVTDGIVEIKIGQQIFVCKKGQMFSVAPNVRNPELEISIADMSEKANVSSFHMIRKFSSENGLTPHKFQLQCRIRKAQELLQNGMKVVDVAAAVGFCDQSHLCRVFKKQVGITPEEYIKSAIISKPD